MKLLSLPSVLALSALLLASPGLAQESDASAAGSADPASEAAAKKLLEVSDMEAMMQKSMEGSLDAQLQQFAQLGISEAGQKKIREALRTFLSETLKWEELEGEFVRLYAEAFTAEELEEITAFYQTPAGKKALTVTPDLMAKGMLMGQKQIEARKGELEKLITPIIQSEMGQR